MYRQTPLEIASAQVVEAALPQCGTPSRLERIAALEGGVHDLAPQVVETVFDITNTQEPEPNTLVPLGIYATRDALASIVRTDRVEHSTAIGVADELQILCTFLKNKMKITKENGKLLGFAAELGMANLVWSGIADGELGLSHGILMGTSGYEKDHSGLKGDVDMLIRTNETGKQGRKKVQIKASHNRAGNIYRNDITVVTVQDVTSTSTPEQAVSRLLKWDRIDVDTKARTYRSLEAALGIRRKKAA